MLYSWTSAAGGGQGGVAPLGFIHGTKIVDRGLKVLFFGLFLLFFELFSVGRSWKRLNCQIFCSIERVRIQFYEPSNNLPTKIEE